MRKNEFTRADVQGMREHDQSVREKIAYHKQNIFDVDAIGKRRAAILDELKTRARELFRDHPDRLAMERECRELDAKQGLSYENKSRLDELLHYNQRAIGEPWLLGSELRFNESAERRIKELQAEIEEIRGKIHEPREPLVLK